ncbi:DUF4129 domain-containing protein [Gordonia sp. VNK1]|uniref:DUF4129 domain-containing protein n=1 Tax=Gordonia oleivorans TaxID=3156618 RepID=UPI0032B5EE7C
MSGSIILLADGLSPDNDQARQWARDELSGSRYQPPQPGLLDRLADGLSRWFSDRVGDLLWSDASVATIIGGVLGLLVLALIVYALLFVRRTPRSGSDAEVGPVLGGDPLSAKEFRRRAEEMLAAGDHDGCVREAMRALTRRSAERGVLRDAPSLTAHEVAVRLRTPFPDHGRELTYAANLFDAVVYGYRHATAEQARLVLDLDESLRSTRPATSTTPAAAKGFAVPR